MLLVHLSIFRFISFQLKVVIDFSKRNTKFFFNSLQPRSSVNSLNAYWSENRTKFSTLRYIYFPRIFRFFSFLFLFFFLFFSSLTKKQPYARKFLFVHSKQFESGRIHLTFSDLSRSVIRTPRDPFPAKIFIRSNERSRETRTIFSARIRISLEHESSRFDFTGTKRIDRKNLAVSKFTPSLKRFTTSSDRVDSRRLSPLAVARSLKIRDCFNNREISNRSPLRRAKDRSFSFSRVTRTSSRPDFRVVQTRQTIRPISVDRVSAFSTFSYDGSDR